MFSVFARAQSLPQVASEQKIKLSGIGYLIVIMDKDTVNHDEENTSFTVITYLIIYFV